MLTSDVTEVKQKTQKVQDIYESNIKEFIRMGELDNIKYSPVQFDVEWEEANRYSEFKRMGKEKWIELAKTGKAITINDRISDKIENTEAGTQHRHAWDDLEAEKKERFHNALKTSTIELPLIAQYEDGRLELVAGNTRLTGLMNTMGKAKAWVFDVPSSLTEAGQKYYHGSYDEFEVGEILTPGEDDYEEGMENVEWYHVLHQHRPMESRQHSWSVFMVADEDDIDVAGGATDYVYEVEPIGDVERHDINWASEISFLLDAGHDHDSAEIAEAAANYWAGKPHHNEQVWEYLAPKARIVGILEEDRVTENKIMKKYGRTLSERSAKEVAADKPAADEPAPEEGSGDREELDKSTNPKYKRLMTIGRSRYPYAKTDMEMLASWFYDVDKVAQARENELEVTTGEQDTAIGFIELQVSELKDELEQMQSDILNIKKPDEPKKYSIYSPGISKDRRKGGERRAESINEIQSSEIGRGQTSKELDDPDADVTIAGALKNGMKVGVEYTGGDLEVSLYGLQKKPVVIGRISMRKEGGTYVSAYSRLSRKYQGQGLGIQLYQFVIKEMGILLKSDLTQSKGSQSVWRKLASTPGINVYGFRAVPGQKREYFTVEPDELNQLAGHFQVYDNEEVQEISDDLGEFELEMAKQARDGEINQAEAWKRIQRERARAKKEMTEYDRAGSYTWLLATSKKEKAKKLESVNGRMRILPLIEEGESVPEVYVDMDGVLVDFFAEWARLNGVGHWREIEPKMKAQGKTIEDALDEIRKQDKFWINLKPESGINELLGGIKKYAGSYTILSSPLSNDPTSEPQKRAWVKQNLAAFPPKKVIIFKNKAKYATQKDGTPNILIDDYSQQINPWKAAGGIGIKHSNSKVKNSVDQLKQSFGNVQQSTKDRGSFTSKSKAHDVKVSRSPEKGGIGSKIKGAYDSAASFGDKQKNIAKKFAAMGQNIDQRPGRQRTNSSFEITLPSKKKRNKKQDKDWSLLKLALDDSIMLEKGLGDCFPVAGRAMIDADEVMEQNGFTLVHALVQGEGELEGRKFFHAFNMLGDVVFDNSNGKNIMTRKEIYFNQGGIDPNLKGGFATYNKEEAILRMVSETHWGPWDLDYALEENIPSIETEIGIENRKITGKEMVKIKNNLSIEENVKTKWETFKNKPYQMKKMYLYEGELGSDLDNFTIEQKDVMRQVEETLMPYVNEYQRLMLSEVAVNADQVKNIFQQAVDGHVKATGNPGLLKKSTQAIGKSLPIQTVKAANKALNDLGKKIQDTEPVQNFDALVAKKIQELKVKLEGSPMGAALVKQTQAYGKWGKENPGKQAIIVAVITLAGAMIAGPAGGAVAGFVMRAGNDLIAGEKLSTAVGRAGKTAAIGALVGFAANWLGDNIIGSIEMAGIEDIEGMEAAMRAANVEDAMVGVNAEFGDLVGELDGAMNVQLNGNINAFNYNYDVILTPDQYDAYKAAQEAVSAAGENFSPEWYAETAKYHEMMTGIQNSEVQQLQRAALEAIKSAQATDLTIGNLETVIGQYDNLGDLLSNLEAGAPAVAAAAQAGVQQADQLKAAATKAGSPTEPETPPPAEMIPAGAGGETAEESIEEKLKMKWEHFKDGEVARTA